MCISLSRVQIDSTDRSHEVCRADMLRCMVGKEGYKDQTLLDEHEKAANKLSFELQSNQYYGHPNAFIQYEHHIDTVSQLLNAIKYRLESHQSFIPFLQPIQDKLQSMLRNAYNRKQVELFCSPQWSETTYYISKIQKSLDALTNLNPSLFDSFYEDYIPFLEQRIESIQQQMQYKDEHQQQQQQQQYQQQHQNQILNPLSYQFNTIRPNYNIVQRRFHVVPSHRDTLSVLLDALPSGQQFSTTLSSTSSTPTSPSSSSPPPPPPPTTTTTTTTTNTANKSFVENTLNSMADETPSTTTFAVSDR
eukprot:UN02693